MNQSRGKKLFSNIFISYLAQIGIIVLSFVGRRVFLHYLSVSYLGINGLYSNILTIISLPELGLDTALVFALYKPVAKNDKALIYSMLKYFHKIYIIIAVVISVFGIALLPFLKFIINSDLPQRDLQLYFLFFLANTVASYFIAEKASLLAAHQQQYVQKTVFFATNFFLQILYIAVLIISKNYYLYLSAMLFATLLNNLILNKICKKIHKDLFAPQDIIGFDKKEIQKNIKATFVYKIGGVAINNTDNILISILVGTAAVGLYYNYNTVISSLQGFIAIITAALISGVGNLSATEHREKQYGVFNALVLFYHFVGALGGVGFYFLFNDFITIWLGSEYLFSKSVVAAISFNFYLTTAVSPVWMYREANGLFQKVKYLMLIRALINIVFSIIMGIYFKITGILVVTALSLLATNFWYEPKLLFNKVFKIPVRNYWFKHLRYLAATLISLGLCFLATESLPSGIIFFLIKALICIVVCALIFFAASFKSDEYKKLVFYVKNRRNKGA